MCDFFVFTSSACRDFKERERVNFKTPVDLGCHAHGKWFFPSMLHPPIQFFSWVKNNTTAIKTFVRVGGIFEERNLSAGFISGRHCLRMDSFTFASCIIARLQCRALLGDYITANHSYARRSRGQLISKESNHQETGQSSLRNMSRPTKGIIMWMCVSERKRMW